MTVAGVTGTRGVGAAGKLESKVWLSMIRDSQWYSKPDGYWSRKVGCQWYMYSSLSIFGTQGLESKLLMDHKCWFADGI